MLNPLPSCPTVFSVMPDPLSLSCPTPIGHLTFPLVMPDPLPSSRPTPIGHLYPTRLPVKPAMTVWYHAMTIWYHALPSSPSCPSSSVMPDPDRASLLLQIAGQAGNDDRVPAMTTFCITVLRETHLKFSNLKN